MKSNHKDPPLAAYYRTTSGNLSSRPNPRYSRMKSTSVVANVLMSNFGRLRKDKNKRKMKKKRGEEDSKTIDMSVVMKQNSHDEYLGVSLIQAARNGLTEIVRNYLENGDFHKLVKDVDEEGYTALHYAARYNQLNVMKLLQKYGADVNVKQKQDEVCPLHLACRYNGYDAVKFLLETQADINSKDVKGRSPLHYATRKGHAQVIKILISVSTCRVNEMDNDLTTPLTMAALQGNAEICETLISRGADVELRDINNMTPLMWAAGEGHTDVCRVLLKAAQRHGPQSQGRYIRANDKEGNTALHLAVQNGSLEVVNLLLVHGANVNSMKRNKSTSLHLGATAGFLDIVKVLVFNGAELNCEENENMTPIHRAALYNRVDILEFLLNESNVQKGADMNARDKKNMTPLHCACWKGQKEAVDFLISRGAEIEARDITLKTPLHWAVQFGHFPVVMSLLESKPLTGKSLVRVTDKNDQTPLHYAAYTGDVQTLKLLLEMGAQCGFKDQEERSPLHIAAKNDRVDCIEALVHASNHETNDNDLDGRTPLLVACLSGHHQSVQVLLSLGGDVSKRDDEQCTALMLAASQGHSFVMKILLDNHASINDVDKMKNTALHYACSNGHVEAVQLLLERRANVTLTNTYNNSALDLAIDNLHQDVVVVMLGNKSTCQSCMSVRDQNGKTPIDRLIAKLPDTVTIILDHCVERTSRDDEEKNLTMIFDYQYIDPGPDDTSSERNRYLALNTMVQHGRDVLLSHPLCQNLLFQKWVRFGRQMFVLNLLTYIGYLTCLTALVVIKYQDCPPPLHMENCTDSSGSTGDSVNRNVTTIPTMMTSMIEGGGGAVGMDESNSNTSKHILTVFLCIFVAVFFIRDFIKILSQRWRYICNVYNTIVWFLMLATTAFLFDTFSMVNRWRAAWIAMFMAWINFIMYLRRIDFLGIYVIMFVSVLTSLVKLILVFMMFCGAFVSSFYIIWPRTGSFEDLPTSIISVLIMTLGEISYIDLKSALKNFNLDGDVLIIIFVFLMPIALMNLMIGVAVGDIEKIQRNAYLKRIGLQVDLMYNIENNMPRFLQKKVHVRRTAIKPNEEPESRCAKLSCFGRQQRVQFIEADKKDKTTSRLESLIEKTNAQQHSIKALTISLQQQNILLHEIARKFDVPLPPQHPILIGPGLSNPYGGGGGGGGGGGPGGSSGGGGGGGAVGGYSIAAAPSMWGSQTLFLPYGHQRLMNVLSNQLTPDPATTTTTTNTTTTQPSLHHLHNHHPQPPQSNLPPPESVSIYQNVDLNGVDRWRKRSIRPTKYVTAFDEERPKSYL